MGPKEVPKNFEAIGRRGVGCKQLIPISNHPLHGETLSRVGRLIAACIESSLKVGNLIRRNRTTGFLGKTYRDTSDEGDEEAMDDWWSQITVSCY